MIHADGRTESECRKALLQIITCLLAYLTHFIINLKIEHYTHTNINNVYIYRLVRSYQLNSKIKKKIHKIMLYLVFIFLICKSFLGCGDTIYSKKQPSAAITVSRRLHNRKKAFFHLRTLPYANYRFVLATRESLVLQDFLLVNVSMQDRYFA